VKADLMKPAEVTSALNAIRPTHLLHLAWITSPAIYWDSTLNRDWLAASVHLTRAFVEAGGRRAVFAGTCAEYDWSGGLCDEATTPLRPASIYGKSKVELWETVQEIAKEGALSAAWGRVFYTFGPGEPVERFIPSVIRSILRAEPAACSEGRQKRDYVFVHDVGEAFATLVLSAYEGSVNIATGVATSVRDVAKMIGSMMGRPDLIRLGARSSSAEAPLVVADVRGLRNEVAFQSRVTLQSGLEITIASLRESYPHG
jgi:nucleoside-diphosphate-sugar epimerase